MLKKLLKYDLKWTLKIVCIFLGIGIVCAILARLLTLAPESIFFTIIISILNGASISLTITGLVNAMIRGWIRTILNLYGDESYLTNTLPVERPILYLSKILNTIIGLGISIVVLLINILIMYYSKDFVNVIEESLQIISSSFNMSIPLFILLITGVIFTEVLFATMCGFYGIIYGYNHNNKKLLYAFIYGFGSYMVCTIITFVLLLIGTAISEDLRKIIFEAATYVDFNVLKGILIFAFVIYLVYSILLYLLSNRKHKKGINIA